MLKSAIEQLLGRGAWQDLKEATSLTPWRKHVLKLLRAIRISVRESVEVSDASWLHTVEENIARGEQAAKESEDVDELLACFTATLLKQVFLQLGRLPNRPTAASVSLSKENWRLNDHRSVQYVQSKQQREAEFWSEQQRQIGFEKQMELHNEYRWSKTTVSYSQWCSRRMN